MLSRRGWTIETLLEHVNTRFEERDVRHQQRYDAQMHEIELNIFAQRSAVDAALAAANLANTKAESATELRFQSVNEFRQTLSDQAAQFITRGEAELSIERNTERIQEVQRRVQDVAMKDDVISALKSFSERLDSLNERVTRGEGKGSGLAAGWGYIVAFGGLIAAVVAIYANLHG